MHCKNVIDIFKSLSLILRAHTIRFVVLYLSIRCEESLEYNVSNIMLFERSKKNIHENRE